MPEHALAIDCPFCGAPRGKRCKELNDQNPFQWVRHYTHLERKIAAQAVPLTTAELESRNRHSASAAAAAARRYGSDADVLQKIPASMIRGLKSLIARESRALRKLEELRLRREALVEAVYGRGISRTRLRKFIQKGFSLE